ncbi:TIGR01620 family protein [Aliiroseovarius subalbicans]|uniref:YcjF family protein n=1 Tax=Aliiroseovarius subalbicans TaxID=2925840 RepID=UPI001F5AF9F5|nr:TIGR01620 family protein [Aliiroseovarius subalbicans]MCI2400467.1 YcjF family protein [Aliiroseovarius subalbicans]
MSDDAKGPAKGPVLIELDAPAGDTPATAPPVPEPDLPTPTGQAMQTVATLTARRGGRIGRWFWGLAVAIVGFVTSVAAYDFVTGLIARNPVLGATALALVVAFIAVMLVMALREWIAFARLRRVDGLHRKAEAALAHGSLPEARDVTRQLARLYAGRDELKWGLERMGERVDEQFEAEALIELAEVELMVPLDQAAQREVEAAARQVATVTAIVPIALADVATALTSNIRMIRRIAEIYGGRSGALGSWRLTRAVMTHLVATGAVAVGDDMIGSLAGGGVLSKLSRRFGEGVVNGALTARVGVAAMEVCRPLPFHRKPRPSVTGLVKRALTGLFGT